MVSLQRLSLTLDKMGETNESIISYEDLLSTALGESGLNLDDLFGNVPGNVLSQATFDDSDLLCTGDGDFLDSINLTGDFSQDNSFINLQHQTTAYYLPVSQVRCLISKFQKFNKLFWNNRQR